MADDAEVNDLQTLINRTGKTLEYGGRKVMIVSVVLDVHGDAMLTKGYVSRCCIHEFCGLSAGVHDQLKDMNIHAAEAE